tara:strand:+ start:6395 stop:8167 length:1773 start_codon:yes stop_codon:yes gene_type:complete
MQRKAPEIEVSKQEQKLLDLIVPRWLFVNGRASMSNLCIDDCYTQYEELKKVCKFHSPVLRRAGGDSETQGSFKIDLGRPVLKGSRRYTLPSHSLLFYIADPEVYIVTNVKQELSDYKYDTLISIAEQFNKYWGRTPSNWNLEKIKLGEISSHPHISSDNKPCLGYYSEAFAQTIAQNNISALCSVAYSFCCNWTRNDAYWDINHAWTAWYDYNLGENFADHLIVKHVIDEMQKMAPDREGWTPFYTHYLANSAMREMQQKGHSKTSLYIYGRLFCMLKSKLTDTSDKKAKTLIDILQIMSNERLTAITSSFAMAKQMNTGPLMDWAVVNDTRDCQLNLQDEYIQAHNFNHNHHTIDSLCTIIRRLKDFIGTDNRSVPSMNLQESDILNIRRMVYRKDVPLQTIQSTVPDDEFYKMLANSVGQPSIDRIRDCSFWLYAIRSFVYRCNALERRIHSLTDHSYEDMFDVTQTNLLLKEIKKTQNSMDYDSPDMEQESKRLERMRVQAGYKIFHMVKAIEDDIVQEVQRKRWVQFLNAKAKDHLLTQIRINLQGLENERNNNISRCGDERNNGFQTFNSTNYSEESQISIASF